MPGRISRRSMAEYIADGLIAGKNKQDLFTQLAAFLVDTRRIKEVDLIVRDIEFMLSEKGVINGTITSAFDLSAETKNALEAFVKEKTNATSVSLVSNVDASVIGGVKINVPGRILDQTIAHQLTVLKTRFKKA